MSDKRFPETVQWGDPNFEETVLRWFNEASSDVSEADDCESDGYEESQHDSNSDISEDEEDIENRVQNENFEEPNPEFPRTANRESQVEAKKNYYGKNRFKWSGVPFQSRSRTRQHNIIVQLPGLPPSANLGTAAGPKAVWKLIFSDEMLRVVLQWTNLKLRTVREKYKDPNKSDLQDLDVIELEAFLGLLLFSAAFNSNHEHIKRLFATDGTGRDIFRCVMNQKRFAILLTCLRFDNPEDRAMRRLGNPAAPISELFDQLISNSQRVYSLSPTTCIDEMLIPFRGRCKFKIYMPNKPAKYGLKIMCLTDSKSHYLYNAYIYTGKDSDGKGLTVDERKLAKPTQSVIRLAKPIQASNRNITADNWFSSIQLVEQLRSRGLTYVGTLRKNKKEIPPDFLPNNQRAVGSSLHGFTENMTLLSYVPKKKKSVVLISSMHHGASVDPESKKPEMILFYNQTKGGVDALDEKCAKHSSSRRTQRWPMAIFFRLLDVSAVNSHVLHQSFRDNPKMEKADFFTKLAMELVKPHMERRLQNCRIPREVRFCIRRVLGVQEEIPFGAEAPMKLEKRKTCSTCPHG